MGEFQLQQDVEDLKAGFAALEEQRDRIVLAIGNLTNQIAGLTGRIIDLENPPKGTEGERKDCIIYAVPARASMRAVPPEG